METKREGPRDLAFVLSEAAGKRAREVMTIASGTGKVEPGTVLGTITADGKLAPSPNASTVGIEGAETATAILCYGVDATSADVEAVVIDGEAEVKEPMLLFDASVDDAAKKAAKIAQLRDRGIKAR